MKSKILAVILILLLSANNVFADKKPANPFAGKYGATFDIPIRQDGSSSFEDPSYKLRLTIKANGKIVLVLCNKYNLSKSYNKFYATII